MKRLRPVALSVGASFVLLGLWIWSYRSYALLAYEAYSGVGTELASVRGLMIFYHFDNYEGGVLPPQEMSFSLQEPKSRQGQRLGGDFDVWGSPGWWNHLGFDAVWDDTMFSGHMKVRILSIPYWFSMCAMISLSGLLYYRRFRSGRSGAKEEEGPSTTA